MNLIGESFAPFVKTQIDQRQVYYGSSSGNDPDFVKKRTQYLYNKEPMSRLVSSVDITQNKLKQLGFDLADQQRLAGNGLAKEFVLFAGASQYGGLNQTPGSLSGSDIFNLRAGLNKSQGNTNLGTSAYGLGGIEFGQVPMPGITGVNVSYKNRGSLRTATITAKAYNRTQLNIIDALYLRLGYTVLLEWGWGANYLGNDGEVKKQLKRTMTNGFLSGSYNSQTVLTTISEGRETFFGNWDAMYGKITNFNWSFNPDGSYDITINLVSIGDIIESLTLNDYLGGGAILTTDAFEDIIDSVKSQIRGGIGSPPTINIRGTDVTVSKDYVSNTGTSYYVRWNGRDLALKTQGVQFDDSNIADMITSVTGLVSAVPITGSNVGILASNAGLNSLTYYLYTSIKLELDNNGIPVTGTNGGVKVLDDSGNRYGIKVNFNSKPNYYIRFKTLLTYIEDNFIYQNKKTLSSTSGTKAITFDKNANDNLIYINKYSVAADYSTVIAQNIDFPKLPDETNTIKVTIGGNTFKSTQSTNAGYLMNVYLNLDWLTQTMVSNVDEEGNISLYSFLSNICQGINTSFGNVNNIDVTIDEDTNTIKFIDDKPIPGILQKYNLDDTPAEFQVYSFSANSPTDLRNLRGSFVKDFSIKTEVSNKLATTLSIGAQAINAVVASNATALQSWNEGLTDRISPIKQMSNEDEAESATEKYKDDILNFISLLEKFENRTLSTEELPQLVNLNKTWQKYIEARQAEIDQTASPSGVGFIPINLNLTMDGLSGMKIYQTFTIDSKFLPLNYPEKLNFLIKKVSHNINQNGWETQIESLSIPKFTSGSVSQSLSQSGQVARASSASSNPTPTPPPIIPAGTLSTEFLYPVYNGTLRGSDANGSGHFGAGRGTRTHQGIDLVVPTSKTITLYAPISGKITRGAPYSTGPKLTTSGWDVNQGFTITGEAGTVYEGYKAQVFYNVLTAQAGSTVNIGDPVAHTIYDMYSAYSPTEGVSGMTNHVHFQVVKDGQKVDPTFLTYAANSAYQLVTDPNTRIISAAERRRLAALVRNP